MVRRVAFCVFAGEVQEWLEGLCFVFMWCGLFVMLCVVLVMVWCVSDVVC